MRVYARKATCTCVRKRLVVKNWMRILKRMFTRKAHEAVCLQCGFPPGRQMRIVSDDPFLHPHECLWCHSILFVPGLMMDCNRCSEKSTRRDAA
jgi:hypothetical protein